MYAIRLCQKQETARIPSERRRRTFRSRHSSRPLGLTSGHTPKYKRQKDDLLVYQGILLRGNRIVVPKALRDRAVDLAHVEHQGIV